MADKTLGISVTGDISDITGKLDDLLNQLDNLADRTVDLVVNTDSSSLQSTEADLQQIGEAAAFTNTELSGIDFSPISSVSSSAEVASNELQSVNTSAQSASQGVATIKPDNITKTTQASQNLGDSLLAVGGAATAIGGYLVVDQWANAAGTWEDNWARMSLAIGEGANNIAGVKEEWAGAISGMTSATGRGVGTIKEFITYMGLADVTSQDVISNLFNGIAGASFVTGYSIEQLEFAAQRAVKTGLLNQRTLNTLGISTNDIMKATGKSIDEVSKEFEAMTPNARAAFLAGIYGAKYGQEANEAFKKSWQGVGEALNRAKEYLARVLGELILPILVPTLTFVTEQLKVLASNIQSADPISRGLLGVTILLGGAFVVVGGALAALAGAYNALGISKAIDAAATWLGVSADNAKFGATTRAIVGEVGRRVATVASTIATGAQTIATYVAVTALTLYNNAIWSTVAAQGRDVISKAASIIATVAQTAATTAATAAQWLLNAAMSANPIGLVVIAIAALVGGLILLYQNNEQVRASINGLWGNMQGLGSYITTGFVSMLNATLKPFRDVINEIKTFGSGLYNAGKNWINDLTRGIKDSMPELVATLQTLSDYFPKSPAKIGPLSDLSSEGMYNYGNNLINSFIQGLKLISDISPILAPIRTMIWGLDSLIGVSTTDVKNNMDKISAKSKEISETAKNAITDSIEAQKKKFQELAEAAKQAYQDAATAASNAMSFLNDSLSGLGVSLPKKKVSAFQGFQDLYDARNANSLAQRNLKKAYEAGGITKAEYDKEMRSLKEQAKQLNDPALFASIAQSGKSIGSAWSSGIANGIQSSKDNLSKAIQSGTAMMTAHSPPKEGPLQYVDQWGLSIGQTFTESIAQGIGSLSGMFGVNSPVSSLPLPSASTINQPNSTGGVIYEINIQIDELGNMTNDEAKEKGKIIGGSILDSITKDTVRQASIGGISVNNMLRS